MSPIDDFAPLGMSSDDMDRVHAAIRRLTKECLDVTRERLRRGERLNLNAIARNAVIGIRGALIGLGLSPKQREAFLVLAAAEILRDHLQNLERSTLKRRVN
jgi:hypothetical protein